MSRYDAYVRRMTLIRELSSPWIGKLDNAEEYSKRLTENFKTIGRLAAENRELLDKEVFPVLSSEEVLPDETVEELQKLGDQLVNADDLENLDIAVALLLSARLLSDAQKKQDDAYLVFQLNQELTAAYTLMYVTSRIASASGLSEKFRKQGIAAAEGFLEFLKKDRFLSLSDEERD